MTVSFQTLAKKTLFRSSRRPAGDVDQRLTRRIARAMLAMPYGDGKRCTAFKMFRRIEGPSLSRTTVPSDGQDASSPLGKRQRREIFLPKREMCLKSPPTQPPAVINSPSTIKLHTGSFNARTASVPVLRAHSYRYVAADLQ